MGAKWEVFLTKTICSFDAAWSFLTLMYLHYSTFLAKYCNFESVFFASEAFGFRELIKKQNSPAQRIGGLDFDFLNANAKKALTIFQ